MQEDVFDLSEIDVKAIDDSGPLPEGWYLCRVNDVDEADTGTGEVLFEFFILGGPHANRKLRDTLWHWANATSPDGEKVAKNRRVLYASRLGLITAGDVEAKRKVSIQWQQAIGRDCFVKVKHRLYETKDKRTGKPTGNKATAANVAFDGIYGVNDERTAQLIPEEVRGLLKDVGGNGGGEGEGGGGSGASGGTGGGPPRPGKPSAGAAGEKYKDLGL